MSKLHKVPKFKSEAEEKLFWETHDSSEYVDWSKAKLARFPKLKPSTRSISIRLPESLLDDIQIMANKNDVPYQSLIKLLLAQSLHAERNMMYKIHLNIYYKSYKNLKELFMKKKVAHHLLDVEVGALLQQYREAMNLNDQEFAQKINVKVSELKAIEQGNKSVLDSEFDLRIEKLFNDSLNENTREFV